MKYLLDPLSVLETLLEDDIARLLLGLLAILDLYITQGQHERLHHTWAAWTFTSHKDSKDLYITQG